MSVSQYKFVSPGVFVSEIDNSQLPKTSNKLGPVIIGRSERGPSMRPVRVESFSEFIEIFGNPIPGGQGGDVWRDGNYTAPTYGPYAAQAWLKNNSPLTYVRLLGFSHTNATAAGAAGWTTKDTSGNTTGLGVQDTNGGAYGLFIIASSSYGVLSGSTGLTGTDTSPATGSLAAVWYVNQGSIGLTGSYPGTGGSGATTASGSAVMVQSVGANKEFKVVLRDKNSSVVSTTTFNFNRDSQKFIRKVFNTNPTLTNLSVTQGANTASYWLGPTYETFLDNTVSSGSTAGDCFGIILGLKNSTTEGSNFKVSAQPAKTGWFFSQDLQSVTGSSNSYQPENMTKLFRFLCLDTGEWTQSNIKISIQDVKASTNPFDLYGTFTVVLRKADDTDNAVRVIERFSECSLNPFSPNYIAKKVGDKYLTWDDTERRYREYGNYNNLSKFVRVEMNSDVDQGAVNAECLPFGVYGPVRFKGFGLVSGSTDTLVYGANTSGATAFANAMAEGGTSLVRADVNGSQVFNPGNLAFTGSFLFPALTIRSASSDGGMASPKDAYWGLQTTISNTNTRYDAAYKDVVRMLPSGYNDTLADNTVTEYSWIVTLDNVAKTSSTATHAVYVSGSRATGYSLTAQGSNNYKAVLDAGFDRFTTPLYGGFDGLDITEKDPFNNTDLAGGSETTNYAFNSVKRAMDCLADPEMVECNMMSYPGLTHDGLTAHLLNICSDRADAFCVIDLPGGYVPPSENGNGDSSVGNRGDVDTTVSNLLGRGVNNSYGGAYYPWVQAKDTITGATLWVPPSIAAIGTMGSSEAKSEIWFAPAGFNRGGLSDGAAGIPIVGVKEKLTVKQRDKLYAANINPIASFPSEGIVIFGQKTLQVTPSALDRINVRRMLIHVKKEISRMAATILFDQNVKATWNRFIGKADPFLRTVKVRFGLVDYKIVLDETTTTPDLIDRNVLYAKIFLKPAKAIEYIALDFNITGQGASFID